jgi:peptide/nickel transport system permease protein
VDEADRVTSTLYVEAVDAPAAAFVEDPRRQRLLGIAYLVPGLIIGLVALFVFTSMEATWRALIGFAGFALVFAGAQTLGRLRFGSTFSVGLWLAIFWLALVLFCAIFADLLPLDHYDKVPKFGQIDRPALEIDEPLGRDTFGRSNLSRVIYGARVSLTIAGITVVFGLVLGSIVGLLGGYLGGPVDYVLNIFINSTLAFPPLILLITIIGVYKPSIASISGALVVLSIPSYSRIMRAQTISLREREFVLAARSMGASTRRILVKEILPNAMLAVAAYTFIQAAVIIVAEGSLAFLGLGIPPPRPSWGTMIADGLLKLKTDPHVVFVPATVMFLTVVSFNRVGDYARRKAIGERDEVS